jgi:2-polyprenyl-3-methyl-5-hydroxy-6-metoxy-1,4-benzoquinol methylase
MSTQHLNYTREIIADQEESLSKIVAKVPHGSLVLDIGCGSGMLGKYLSENKECIVDGVDIDPDAVALAKPKYRKVGVFNLENESLATTFKAEAYDCIVMADVIEHLVHPEQLFQDVKQLLKPAGILLFSIPNITHLSAGLELVLGKFGYRNSGLLDSTHVRFYSRQSFVEKLEANGIYADEIDTVKREIDDTEFVAHPNFPQHWIRDIVQDREDALTYQWIISAKLFKPKKIKQVNAPQVSIPPSYLTLASRLYWRSSSDENFSEAHSIAGHLDLTAPQEPVIVFDFAQANCRYPLVQLRLDPVSDNTAFIFREAILLSSQHQTLWSTDHLESQDLINAHVIPAATGQGQIVLPENSDPQWNMKFGSDLLTAITPGCTLRLSLKLSASTVSEVVLKAYQAVLADIAQHKLQLNAMADVNSKHEATLQQHQLQTTRNLQEKSLEVAEIQTQLSELSGLHAHTQQQNELHAGALLLKDGELTALANLLQHTQERTHQHSHALVNKDNEISSLGEQLHSAQEQINQHVQTISLKDTDISTLTAQYTGAQEQINQHVQTISLKDTDISTLTAQYTGAQEQIKKLVQTISLKNTDISTITAQHTKAQDQISQLTLELATAHNEFASLTALATQKDKLIGEQHQAAIERSTQLHKLQLKHAELSLQFENTRLELIERETVLALVQKNLALSEKSLSETVTKARNLQTVLATTEQTLSHRTEQYSGLQLTYSQTLSTLSWRVTKPLRWIRARFNRLRSI